jgi:two-component system, OmpR family, manganese sensing sensor histidine kinase
MKLFIFDRIRLRLSLTYLITIGMILATFAVGVRILYYHVLHQKIIEQLTLVAERAIDNIELDRDRLTFDRELTDRHRTHLSIPVLIPEHNLELFNRQGHLLARLGKISPDLPFSFDNFEQVSLSKSRFQYVTIPLTESETELVVGYIRVSQSLAGVDASVTKLDLGLLGGTFLTLIVSTGGAIWLTKQAIKPAENTFQQLQQFTADASHELRSPLMAILSNVSVALKYPEGIRAGDVAKFQSIDSAATQMRRLTEDLLWLARNNDGTDRSRTKVVDLSKILENAIENHRIIADRKQIKINYQLANNLTLFCDELELHRVFTNLLENAIFYNQAGGSISIELTQQRQFVLVKISDTGIGIDIKHLPKIFDRFWRADLARTQWEGGSGLGLAIVKDIITRHQGQIEVTSKKNVGSCFIIQLPIPDRSRSSSRSATED